MNFYRCVRMKVWFGEELKIIAKVLAMGERRRCGEFSEALRRWMIGQVKGWGWEEEKEGWSWRVVLEREPFFVIFLQNLEDNSIFISGNFLFFYSLFTFVMCNSFGYILLGMKVSWYLLRTVICETEILLNCWRLGSWLVVSSVKS